MQQMLAASPQGNMTPQPANNSAQKNHRAVSSSPKPPTQPTSTGRPRGRPRKRARDEDNDDYVDASYVTRATLPPVPSKPVKEENLKRSSDGEAGDSGASEDQERSRRYGLRNSSGKRRKIDDIDSGDDGKSSGNEEEPDKADDDADIGSGSDRDDDALASSNAKHQRKLKCTLFLCFFHLFYFVFR
jgi:hypothetical protein